MALRVIDGVPGAGKTFYAVWHLANHYFKKNATTGVYELSRECVIITNIDGFEPDHVDLKKEISQAGKAARRHIECSALSERRKETALEKLDPVAEFFSYEYQERYKEGKLQIVYVIDEAQRYFRKGADRVLREKKVFDYFEYHRHWGQDIYVITQNVKKLPPDIVHLPEYIVSARPRVRAIGRGFRYDWISSGERIKTEARSKDPAIFALYKSMDASEQEKISNPVLKTVGFMFLFAFAVIFSGYKYYSSRADRGVVESSVSEKTSSPSSGRGGGGGSYIPVGRASVVPPEPRYIVLIPLSGVTSITATDMRSLYVWRGQLIPPAAFPHKTIYMSGQRYAVVDYELFDFMFSNDEDRPTDFIVQVAPPETKSDGSVAPQRSPVERLERNRRSAEAERTKRG